MTGTEHPALVAHDERRRLRIGLAVLLLSTVAFGINNVLARWSYDHGTNVLTLLVGRTTVALLAVAAYLSFMRLWRRIARADLPILGIAALAFTTGTVLLLESFRFLPVSLAILLFYLFPIIVALIYLATGEERLTPIGWIGIVAAFFGLAMALEVFNGFDFNAVGVALSVAAAFCLAINIALTHRLMRRVPGILVTFWLFAFSQLVFVVGMVAVVGVALPDRGEGVLVFSAAVVAGPIAIITFYVGLSLAGGTRTALVMNAEPLTTILFAAAILGEALGWLQYAGAAVVIASIVLVTLAERQRAPGPRQTE